MEENNDDERYYNSDFGRLNHPDDLKKYFSRKTFKDFLEDKTNPVVYCTLSMEGKSFLYTSSYAVMIHQVTNGHDQFTITVPDDALDSFSGYVMENSKNILGKTVTINFHQYGSVKQIFVGIICQVRNKKDNGYGYLFITGHSPGILLESGKNCQSFEQKTLEQIIKETVSGYPEEAQIIIDHPNADFILPYMVQYNESDYQFIKRLAIRFGEYFYYNGQQLIFGRKIQPIIKLEENINLIEVEFEMNIKPQFFRHSAYDAQAGQTIEKLSNSVHIQYKENPFQAVAINASEMVYKKVPEMFCNHTGISDNTSKELSESVRMERENRENLVMVRGQSRDPDLRIGSRAKLIDINIKAMETYRIIEIKHFHDAEEYYNEFVGIPDLFNAPYQDSNAVPLGEDQPARVIDNNDPTGGGRVRVQFPWQESKGEKTPWLRVTTSYGGAARGDYKIPEIGDEVLVSFESDNAEKPYVLGAMYNGVEKSGYHTPNNDLKAERTRSGVEKLINDAEGSYKRSTPDGSFIKMDGKRKIEINTDTLEINVRQLIINASQSTEITTNDFILNALTKIYIFSNFLKQTINGFMHLFSNHALINSTNTLDIEAKEAKLHGTEKTLVHSNKKTIINSKGIAEMHGNEGNCLTNKAKEASTTSPEQIALANVYFRPIDTWNGEFGMDWLRENDNGLAPASDPAYSGIIEGGYKDGVTDLTGGATGTAYTHLKTQYEIIPIKKQPIAGSTAAPPDGEYFVSHLTLFPKDFVDALPATVATKPKYEADLKVLVEIEEDIDKLEFEFDNILFDIDKKILQDKTKTTGLTNSADVSVKITCKKDLDSDKEIKIYAYPKNSTQPLVDRKLAGKIIVLQNDSRIRKEEKFVLVKVFTDILGNGNITDGDFTLIDKQNFYYYCYQSLIIPILENSPNTLDLSDNVDFKSGGKYIDRLNRLNEDEPGMFADVKKLFLEDKDAAGNLKNAKYTTGYFTAFAMDVTTYDATPGQIQDIGIRNLILFTPGRYDTTMAHETFHGLGLYHTHRDAGTVISENNRKYIYQKETTTNIMSYNTGIRKSLWRWQMHITNSNISER